VVAPLHRAEDSQVIYFAESKPNYTIYNNGVPPETKTANVEAYKVASVIKSCILGGSCSVSSPPPSSDWLKESAKSVPVDNEDEDERQQVAQNDD
jgi:hypothetical protein